MSDENREPYTRRIERRGWFSDVLVRGTRIAWESGGIWERVFILAPYIWAAYAGTVFAWLALTGQPFETWFAFSAVALSFIALHDVWLTPVLSAKVLLGLVGTGQLRDDQNAQTLAAYLEAHGQGGRWNLGNLVSGFYFLFFIGWGLFAILFADWTGLTDGWSFVVIHLAALFALFWLYQRLLRRLEREAGRKGFVLRRSESVGQ